MIRRLICRLFGHVPHYAHARLQGGNRAGSMILLPHCGYCGSDIPPSQLPATFGLMRAASMAVPVTPIDPTPRDHIGIGDLEDD